MNRQLLIVLLMRISRVSSWRRRRSIWRSRK